MFLGSYRHPHPRIMPEELHDAWHSLESVADDEDEDNEETNPGQTTFPLFELVLLGPA